MQESVRPSGRLVVVSNRVPDPSKSAQSAGGLAVAVDAALKQRGGLWFGWSGRTSMAPGEVPGALSLHEVGPVTFALTDLSKRDLDEYYSGFANRALWPICHYRLDLLQISTAHTAGYFRVNGLFAERLAPLLRADDLVWIHDYHLIPLAASLRQMGVENRMGFFLHIPWPPSDTTSALPAYERLLRGLAAYDVIGFQTAQDAENFIGCLVRERIGRHLGEGWCQVGSRRIYAGAFPISIDTPTFREKAVQADRSPLVKRMWGSLGDKSLVIGVDRLDYSKGIRQRIEAFSCYVRSNQEARGKVVYLQVTPKSRSDVPEYKQMQHEVAEEVGAANGSFGDIDWTPIRYINKNVGHAALAGLYRMARVGLVTPLRDGMNLVAKEYVAAQDADDPGVLILSRFAGAAHELDAALLVNPYDVEATAGAIARALKMPVEERRERWGTMMAWLEANTVGDWCRRFLHVLGGEAGLAAPLSADAASPSALGATRFPG